MRLLLIGAPGAGKRTQAAHLAEHFEIPTSRAATCCASTSPAQPRLGKPRSRMSRGETRYRFGQRDHRPQVRLEQVVPGPAAVRREDPQRVCCLSDPMLDRKSCAKNRSPGLPTGETRFPSVAWRAVRYLAGNLPVKITYDRLMQQTRHLSLPLRPPHEPGRP
jgi:hypothetical protein